MLLVSASLALAGCVFTADVAALSDALSRAEQAYLDFEVEAFEQATAEVDYVVPCLGERVPTALAVRLHRLRGIGFFTAERSDDALAALRAARIGDPDWVPSTALFPEGFALRDLYLAQPTASEGAIALPRPARGTQLVVDGLATRSLPGDAAVLLQIEGADAGVRTAYLLPGDPVPDYPGAQRRRTVWWIGSGVSAVASVATYGAALGVGARRFEARDEAELGRIQTSANTLSVVSGGLATAALVQLGLAAWTPGPR